MTKNDTISEIRRLNRSADAEFLSAFSDEELSAYLDRLTPSTLLAPPNPGSAERTSRPF